MIRKTALVAAIDLARRPGFRLLLLPEPRWNRLSRFDYRAHGRDGAIECLASSHVDVRRANGPAWIGRTEMRAGLQLWLSPAELVSSAGWRSHIVKLLSDAQTARCIRYAALRLKAELRGLSLS